MNSYLKNTTATIAGTFCLLILLILLTQNGLAQSGNTNSGFQFQQTLPAQTQPSAAVQNNFGTNQGYVQRPQTPPYQPQETRRRETARASFEQFDHRAWDALLQKYVDRNGDVDYGTWQANPQDRATLMDYLRGMNAVDTSGRSSRSAEMAFWINAYNALTIEGILQLFPTKSIKDHAPDANGFNIWDDFKLPVGGREYSLNDIEHNVLRKMGDPRIHFAIVCASKGCPQLAQRAYFPESLDQQLANSAGLFFHTPSKFSYDLQRGQLGLSPIIDWFGDDFGRSDQERLQYLSQFMPADARGLALSGTSTISYLDYDWNLNLAPMRTTARTQVLRPQGSTNRQAGYSEPEGSSTRGQFEAFRPAQSQGVQSVQGGQCSGRGGCSGRSANGFQRFER